MSSLKILLSANWNKGIPSPTNRTQMRGGRTWKEISVEKKMEKILKTLKKMPSSSKKDKVLKKCLKKLKDCKSGRAIRSISKSCISLMSEKAKPKMFALSYRFKEETKTLYLSEYEKIALSKDSDFFEKFFEEKRKNKTKEKETIIDLSKLPISDIDSFQKWIKVWKEEEKLDNFLEALDVLILGNYFSYIPKTSKRKVEKEIQEFKIEEFFPLRKVEKILKILKKANVEEETIQVLEDKIHQMES